MIRAAAIVALLAAAIGGYRWWASPERQIRRVLDGIADSLSHDEPVNNLAAMAGAAGLQEYFTVDVVIEPGRSLPALTGRDAVMGAAAGVLAATQALRVEFADVEVTMGPGDSDATVRCTITASLADRAGQESVDARELVVTLRLVEGQWAVARATAQNVLEPVT